MLDIYKSIILGIVEGLTEFIPVSSTGHLIIIGDFLNFHGEFSKTFNISIQLGAILSVIIIFRNNFKEYLKLKPNLEVLPNIFQIIIISIPAFITGYLLHNFIKTKLFSPFTVAIGLILGSFLMLYADIYRNKHKKIHKLTLKKSFILGLFQCLALWPGVSRSGSTISGAILLGLDYKKASAVSFICAVPIMIGATAYELIRTKILFSQEEILLLIVGFSISFFVGWLSILFFLKLISKIKLKPFAFYRIILAILILYSNKLSANHLYLIKTETKEITLTSSTILEQIYNLRDGNFYYLINTKEKTPQFINEIKNIPSIDLNKAYIKIKTLNQYLFLQEDETKKTISELLIGSYAAYFFIKNSSTDYNYFINFLNDYSIGIDKTKRYYFEFCIDTENITNVLWSMEYCPKTEKLKIIKTPELLISS